MRRHFPAVWPGVVLVFVVNPTVRIESHRTIFSVSAYVIIIKANPIPRPIKVFFESFKNVLTPAGAVILVLIIELGIQPIPLRQLLMSVHATRLNVSLEIIPNFIKPRTLSIVQTAQNRKFSATACGFFQFIELKNLDLNNHRHGISLAQAFQETCCIRIQCCLAMTPRRQKQRSLLRGRRRRKARLRLIR